MSDLYMSMTGDIVINGNKDIAMTTTGLQDDVQQIYLRLMTEPGDFYVYPQLGTDLSMLYGMPQSRETGEFGKRLIRASLEREDIFKGRNIKIEAIPTGPDSIRFDVHIVSEFAEPVVLSVTQDLGA
jgi:hypothetical protein